MPTLATKDGTTLHYNDWGSGRPIVLVHGWPLTADMWEYQSVFLAEHGFRVVTYDRRGFGRSGQPWAGYDYDTMASDLGAVIDHLGLSDVTLAGFSMGGGEVARYAAGEGAGKVGRIALISAVTPYLLKSPDNPQGVDKSIFDEMVAGLENDRPGFLAPFGKKFLGAGMLNFSVSNEILQWAQQMALTASPRATLACVRAFSETDFRGDLRAIKVPLLVIHGDSDQTVPAAASAERVPEFAPHAELKIYPGAPHGLMYTARDLLNEHLASFAGG